MHQIRMHRLKEAVYYLFVSVNFTLNTIICTRLECID